MRGVCKERGWNTTLTYSMLKPTFEICTSLTSASSTRNCAEAYASRPTRIESLA